MTTDETPNDDNVINLDHERDPYAPITFSWGDIDYAFGAECYVEFTKNDERVRKVFARNVWPRQIYEHVDDEEYGVRFEYVSQTREWKHGLMGGSAFVDKASGRRACADAADHGVDVETGSEYHLAYALGRWRKACDAQIIKVTKSSGWKQRGRVYINGASAFGDSDWYADEDVIAIKRRSQRAGSLEEWLDTIREEVTTPALRAALGVSLAGPLVGRLHLHPFILHVYGNSSSGKSTAGRVAASVWSSPEEEDNGLLQMWKNSLGGFELLATSADGACLVLDELGTFGGNDRQFADLVHMLTAKSGKVTMTQNRNERESNSWAITGVSTGEISMKARIGNHLQGGQMVRMVDLDVNHGDVTLDAQHADRTRRRLTQHHGHAGDAWVEYLVGLGMDAPMLADEWIAHWRNQLRKHNDDTPEGGRILSHVHLIGAAIGMAREGGLIPWPSEEDADMLNWIAARVMSDREENKTPNERALEQWYTMIDTEPASFPFESDTSAPRELYGYSVKVKPHGNDEKAYIEIWTSERMIKRSGFTNKAGVTPRKWIQWCLDNDHCRAEDDARCANKQRKWKVFTINAPPVDDDGEFDDPAPF